MTEKNALKDAIAEMRSEMRGRVGKKLLSIEVLHHAGEDDDEEDDGAVKGDDVEKGVQKKIGMPLLGG